MGRRHFMSEKEISLGRLFVQEAVRAGTWGLVLLLVMGMFLMTIKQEIKEGIAYSVDRMIATTINEATDPALLRDTKEALKKGVEYSVTMAGSEVRKILAETTTGVQRREE
jgi:hypothetical protein